MPDLRMGELERGRAPQRFILLYALAWAGGSIAYTPFLSILLPARVEGTGAMFKCPPKAS